MAKKDKFAGTESAENQEINAGETSNLEQVLGDAVNTEGAETSAETSAENKPQSEAGAKISAAQKGVPKKRIIATTQVGDAEPVEHASLCAAVVAHGLSKEVDWFTARNALKSSDTWVTKGKIVHPVAEDAPEGTEPVIEEYDVTFRLVDASWKNAPAAVTEQAGEQQSAESTEQTGAEQAAE